MAPTTDIFCKFHGRREYGMCHRYDQSALNILLINRYNGDATPYLSSSTVSVLSVDRGSMDKEKLSVCDNNHLLFRMKSKRFF